MSCFYLPYTATTNPENVRRLLRSIELQRELDEHFGSSVSGQRCLFTDDAGCLPPDAAAFFDGGIFESYPYVQAAAGRRRSLLVL